MQQVVDGVGKYGERVFFVAFGWQQPDTHESLGLCLFCLLLHVGIGCFYLLRIIPVCIAFVSVFGVYGREKECVVEIDDILLGAVVDVERYHVNGVSGECFCDIAEQAPFSGSPSVDALLYVSHYEVVCRPLGRGLGVAQTFAEQHLEVFPLHYARVLELVDHDVVEMCSYLLEDERRVGVVYHHAQQVLCVAEQESVGFGVHLFHLVFYVSEQSEVVDVLERCGHGVHYSHGRSPFLFRPLEQGYEAFACSSDYEVPVFVRLRHPVFFALHAVCNGLRYEIPVTEVVFDQSVEVFLYSASLPTLEILLLYSVSAYEREEFRACFLEDLSCCVLFSAQLGAVGGEEFAVGELFVHHFSDFTILVVEYHPSEILH